MINKSPVTLIHRYKTLPCPAFDIQMLCRKLYSGERIPFEQKTDIILCSDYIIKKLNRDYRGKDYATDVLSFSFNEPDYLGEIYISLQRVKVQARRFGISYNDEVLRLLVHGMFHLLGCDHQTTVQRNEMEEKEQRYFNVRFP
jgi:probable rRNA maturation factor